MSSIKRKSSSRNRDSQQSMEDTASKYFKSGSTPVDQKSRDHLEGLASEKTQETSKPDNSIKDAIKLGPAFFNVSCVQLARALLGQLLVRKIGSQRVTGTIVETEAYLGIEDKAAHSYKGKRTERTEAMFMKPGTAYVYNIYGMYCCLNISSQGDGCAVLLRALEPKEGIDLMQQKRQKSSKSSKKVIKDKELTNGPSKLCQALDITKSSLNQSDLTSSTLAWLERGSAVSEDLVVSGPRINIGYAEEWKEKPLRFYLLGNACVSQRDKPAEETLKKSHAQKS